MSHIVNNSTIGYKEIATYYKNDLASGVINNAFKKLTLVTEISSSGSVYTTFVLSYNNAKINTFGDLYQAIEAYNRIENEQ